MNDWIAKAELETRIQGYAEDQRDILATIAGHYARDDEGFAIAVKYRLADEAREWVAGAYALTPGEVYAIITEVVGNYMDKLEEVGA